MLVTGLLTLQTMFVGVGSLGRIIYVPADAPTIQIAIVKAAPFDTIIVAPGTYSEAISFGGKVITVQRTNPNDPSVVTATIINAGGLGSVVTFSGGEDQVNTVLDGFTITGGTIGIDAHSSRAVIRRCVIRDNSSYGIYQADGTIEDSQVLNNNSYGLSDCDGTIRRCVIRNNYSAGLWECDGTLIDSRVESTRQGNGVSGGSVDILRCVIAFNSGAGVTVVNTYHTGDIEQSYIVANASYGIYGAGGDAGLVRNCVIAGNRESGLLSSRKHVLNTTVTGNRRYGFDGHTGTIRHVILWDNVQGALVGSTTPLFSGTANPYFVQPGFWDQLNNVWVDGDYHLTQNSPYINAGDPNYPNDPNRTTEDIDGNPRIVGVRVDIGAYEFQAACVGQDFDDDGTPDICDRDIDGDGIPNVPDVCDDTPQGIPVDDQGRPQADLNLDCKVDLRDYAIFQNSMIGP